MSDQQTTEGDSKNDDVSDKSQKKDGSSGTFRSTFKFSFGRKRTTESTKPQATSDKQGQSTELKDQSAQSTEVPPVSENQGQESIQPKPETGIETKQGESHVLQPPDTASDSTVENTEQSTVQQDKVQGDEQGNKDACQGLLLSKGPEEREVPTIAAQPAVQQHPDQVMLPSESSEDQGGLHKQRQPATLQDQKEEKKKANKTSSIETKQGESHVLQPPDTASDNTVENTEQSTAQQDREQEGDQDNKDQVQQAATLDNQDTLPTPEESSVGKKQIGEHSEVQALQPSGILESFDPLDNTGQSTVQLEDEGLHKKDGQLQRQLSPDYKDSLPDEEDSSLENTKDEEHSQGQVLQPSDILGSFDPLDSTGQSTVQLEDEALHKKDGQLQRHVSPDYEDAPSNKGESPADNTHAKEHRKSQVLQPSGILESFDPLDNTGQSTVQLEDEALHKKDDQLQRQVSPDYEDASAHPEESPVRNIHAEEHSKSHGQVLQSSDILDSFDPIVQHKDEYRKEDETRSQVTGAPSDPEGSPEQNKQTKKLNEDHALQSSDIFASFDPLDDTGEYTTQQENEHKENKQLQIISPTTPDFHDALFDPEESSVEDKVTEKHSKDRVLQPSDILEAFDPSLDITGQSTVQEEDVYKTDDEAQRQVSSDYEDSPTDPGESLEQNKKHIEDQVPQASDILGSFDPLSNIGQSTGQQDNEYKKDDQTQEQVRPDHRNSPLDPEKSSWKFEQSDTLESGDTFDDTFHVPAQQKHKDELKSDDQTQKGAFPDTEDLEPPKQPYQGQENKVQDLTKLAGMECQDISAHKDQSLSEDSQDGDNDESLLWFDTPEYLDVPQQPGQLTTEQKQTQEDDRVNLVQWSNSAEVPQDSEHPKEKFKEQDKSQAPWVHTQSSPVQKQSEEEGNFQVLQWPDSLERYDDNKEHSMRHNQESSGQDISHHQKESQEHASDMNQVLLLSGDQEGKDVPTFQKQSIVQQHQIDENDASQGLLLSKGPEERNVPTIAEQLKFAVQQFLDQVMVPSESSEDQDVLHEQKQSVTLQDQKDVKEKGNVSSESDSSEFQDVPLQDDEGEASQVASLTEQEGLTLPKQSMTQRHQSKEQKTSEALPLSEGSEAKGILHHPKQPIVQHDQADDNGKGDVSSESDSSEFQDIPLQDEEDEVNQSSGSTDQEATTLSKQSMTRRQELKEHETSKALPFFERQDEQKDLSLLEQPTVPRHEAQKDKKKQGMLLSEGTEIQKGPPRPEQQGKKQMPPLSEVSKSQGGAPGQLAAQPYKAVDDDPTQVLLFDPEDNELPLSEGSTDQDDTPLQYFNTSSESDSSDFQDVPSDDEDASTFLDQPKVQRHRAEKQKSHVLPLSRGLKDRIASSHSNQSSVHQHKTDQHEKTAKVSSESDSLEFEDIPSPVREFPKQRFEERGLDKSRTSVESEIPEDEGVLLSPISPKEKHSLLLQGSEGRQRGKGRVSPQPKDLENRLLEANTTIATLMGELDQVRGEIKERANISTDVVKESEHRHRSDTKTPARSVEIGVNTEGDKIQEADLSQASAVYEDDTTKAQSNIAVGEAKKQQKMVSCGVQTDFADNSDAAQQPAEKSEDKDVQERQKPTGKTETKTKKKSAIVEMLKDDEELKAKFNIAENLKKALAAKSKAGQQGKAEAPPSEPVKVAEIRHLDRITFGGKGSEPGKFNRPRGVAVSTKNEIFVADRDNRRIQVHNMKGEAIRQIPTTVPGQETLTMRPDDIAIDGNDLLWIVGSDWSTEFVIPYTMEGEPLGMFDLPDTVRFRGITVNPRNNHVIVTLTDKTFGTRGEVRVFRPDGWQLRRVGITQGMVAPMFVTLDKDDNILVSDYGTHSVYAFDQDGEFLFKFGGYGSGVGQLKDPRGICVDSSGNIIVADFGNKRLEMFTNGGKFLRHVTDSAGRPDGIAVGPDGQLVVTEWNHTASIILSY